MKCVFCERELVNKGCLVIHEKSCQDNPNRVQRFRSPNAGAQKGSIPWNKDLHGDPRFACSDERREVMRLDSRYTGKAKTVDTEQERIEKIRIAMRSHGGYRQGSGRSRHGWYQGIYCDSSWELAYVIYNLDHGTDIRRNHVKRIYDFAGKTRSYTPDFVVDGVVVEIKGYITEQWLAKLAANPDIHVIYKDDMKIYLDYVTSKYGKEFIKFYEEHERCGSHPAG